MNEFEKVKNTIDKMALKLDKEIGKTISAFTLTVALAVQTSINNEEESNKLADYMFEKVIKILNDYKKITVEALNEE